MGGASLLLAMTVVMIDFGWESVGPNQYRYVVQIPPEQYESLTVDQPLTSTIPEELRGKITEIEIRLGDGPVPREEIPERDPMAQGNSGSTPYLSAYPAPPDEEPQTQRGQNADSGYGLPRTLDEAREQTTAALGQVTEDAVNAAANAARNTGTDLLNNLTQRAGQALGANANPSTRPAAGAPTTTPSGYGIPSTSPNADRNFATGSSSTFQSPSTSTPAGDRVSVPTQPTRDALTQVPPQGNSPQARPSTGPSTATGQSPLNSSGWNANVAAQTQPSTAGGSRAATGSQQFPVPPNLSTQNQSSVRTPTGSNTGGYGYNDPPALGNQYATGNAGMSPANPSTSRYEFWDPQSGLTAEQQRLQDEAFLEEVAYQDGIFYDTRSGQRLESDDLRYKYGLDLLVRSRLITSAERDAALKEAWEITARKTQLERQSSLRDRFATTGNPSGLNGGVNNGTTGNLNTPAQRQNSSGFESDNTSTGRSNQSDLGGTDGAGLASRGTSQDTSSPSDDKVRTQVEKFRPNAIFTLFFLVSMVANAYLLIVLRRLLQRYRNLVAGNRANALSM